MKSIVRNLVGTLVILSVRNSFAVEMTHPIFGYSYSVGDVEYRSADKCILDALNLKLSKYWIFSEYLDALSSERYVVAGGLIVNHSDNQKGETNLEPDFGAVIKISAGVCKVLGSPDVVLDEGFLIIRVREGLIESAVQMATKSEGERNFLKHFSSDMYGSQLPEVRRKIDQLNQELRVLAPKAQH